LVLLKPLRVAVCVLGALMSLLAVAVEPPLEGPQYDALLSLTVDDPDYFEYTLQAPMAIDGMDYAMAVLVYSNSTIIDGYERTGPLIDMEEVDDKLVGSFAVPIENRAPRVWAVVYYGNLGLDEPWIRTYALVIDFPAD
jgi:hypothetical protein